MICGIIAEYNIFHNGHKYLIDEVKKNADAVVAVMSGSFVQRGDVAIADKWSRAKMALLGGADLVLELPVCYALNAAPNFATGAVSTLNALGVIDTIAFGSESGDTDNLMCAANLLENEDLDKSETVKKYMAEGMNYPSAISMAYKGEINSDLLSMPNNILAVEYIRSIFHTGSSIKPIAIKRKLSKHDGSEINDGFASASKIREMIFRGENVSSLIPYNLSEITSVIPYSISALDSAIIAKLRTSKPHKIAEINEVCEGLENRIIGAAMECDSFSALCEQVKNKRYTMSKIRRIIIASLIGFTKDIYKPVPDYIRVLGMNKKGMEILKNSKKICTVPIITKTADYKENSRMFELDIRAGNIAALCSPVRHSRSGGMDYKTSPVIL